MGAFVAKNFDKTDSDLSLNIYVVFDIILSMTQEQRFLLGQRFERRNDGNLVSKINKILGKNLKLDVEAPLERLFTSNTAYDARFVRRTLEKISFSHQQRLYALADRKLQALAAAAKDGDDKDEAKDDVKVDDNNKDDDQKYNSDINGQIQRILTIICTKTNYEINNIKEQLVSDMDNEDTSIIQLLQDTFQLTLLDGSGGNQVDLNVSLYDSMNRLYTKRDKDKIVVLKCLTNLFALKRNEEVLDDSEDSDDKGSFDESTVPLDLIDRYLICDELDYNTKDEFDDYLSCLNEYFAQNHHLHSDGVTFSNFALEELNLPPLMKYMLQETFSIVQSYHGYFGDKIAQSFKSEQDGTVSAVDLIIQ